MGRLRRAGIWFVLGTLLCLASFCVNIIALPAGIASGPRGPSGPIFGGWDFDDGGDNGGWSPGGSDSGSWDFGGGDSGGSDSGSWDFGGSDSGSWDFGGGDSGSWDSGGGDGGSW